MQRTFCGREVQFGLSSHLSQGAVVLDITEVICPTWAASGASSLDLLKWSSMWTPSVLQQFKGCSIFKSAYAQNHQHTLLMSKQLDICNTLLVTFPWVVEEDWSMHAVWVDSKRSFHPDKQKQTCSLLRSNHLLTLCVYASLTCIIRCISRCILLILSHKHVCIVCQYVCSCFGSLPKWLVGRVLRERVQKSMCALDIENSCKQCCFYLEMIVAFSWYPLSSRLFFPCWRWWAHCEWGSVYAFSHTCFCKTKSQ